MILKLCWVVDMFIGALTGISELLTCDMDLGHKLSNCIGITVFFEDCTSSNEQLNSVVGRFGDGINVDPTVDLQQNILATGQGTYLFVLFQHRLDELLPTKTRVHTHHQREVSKGQGGRNLFDWRIRIDGNSGSSAQFSDLL